MNPDIRIIDPLEKIRNDFMKTIKEEQEKKQRVCLHKWFNLTARCSVCTICQKVSMK